MNPTTARSSPAWVQVAEEVVVEAGGVVFDPEAAKATDEPFAETSDGFDDLTVADLKQILKEEGLSVAGNKADLIARLRSPISDSEPAPADPEEAAQAGEEEAGPSEDAPVEQPEEGDVSESEESSGEEPVVE